MYNINYEIMNMSALYQTIIHGQKNCCVIIFIFVNRIISKIGNVLRTFVKKSLDTEFYADATD